jgi:hypothetical protein
MATQKLEDAQKQILEEKKIREKTFLAKLEELQKELRCSVEVIVTAEQRGEIIILNKQLRITAN